MSTLDWSTAQPPNGRPVGRARRRVHLRIATAVSAAAAMLTAVTVLTGTAFAATLFSDDFEDGNSAGWSTSGGSWSVVTDGSRAYRQGGTGADAKALSGSTAWMNYAVQ